VCGRTGSTGHGVKKREGGAVGKGKVGLDRKAEIGEWKD